MGGSIHISGTGSSIVDTVFVCRRDGVCPERSVFRNASELVSIMRGELLQLVSAGMKPTAGDIRCIAYGHITRMAIVNLRAHWDALKPTDAKLEAVKTAMDAVALLEDVRKGLEEHSPTTTNATSKVSKQQLLELQDAGTL